MSIIEYLSRSVQRIHVATLTDQRGPPYSALDFQYGVILWKWDAQKEVYVDALSSGSAYT